MLQESFLQPGSSFQAFLTLFNINTLNIIKGMQQMDRSQ